MPSRASAPSSRAETIDAIAGDLTGIAGGDRLLNRELLEHLGGDLRGLPRLVALLQHVELVVELVDPRERLEQRLVVEHAHDEALGLRIEARLPGADLLHVLVELGVVVVLLDDVLEVLRAAGRTSR